MKLVSHSKDRYKQSGSTLEIPFLLYFNEDNATAAEMMDSFSARLLL